MMRLRPAAGSARRLWTEACRNCAVYLVSVSLGIHHDIRSRLRFFEDVPALIEEQTAFGALRAAAAAAFVHIPNNATRWRHCPDPVSFFSRPREEEASSGSGKVTSLLPPMSPGAVFLLILIGQSAVLGWHNPAGGALALSVFLGIAALLGTCRYANIGWLSLAYLEDRETQFPGYPSGPSVYLAANTAQYGVRARDLVRFAKTGMTFQRHLRAAKRQGWILVPPDSDEPDVRTLHADGCRLRLVPKGAPGKAEIGGA
ncbi:MAG: hypothetical protein ABSF03_20680 [Streptosporangiaceae bacterium]|jgi:hypothetical protein